MKRDYKHWSKEDIDWLKENYRVYGGKHCAFALGRTLPSVWTMAFQLGIKKKGDYSNVYKCSNDDEAMSMRVAVEGVMALIEGRLPGPPLPGTLADRVNDWACRIASENWNAGWRAGHEELGSEQDEEGQEAARL